ncbi:MAG: glycerophosphodiester phosphodiesterase [Alcanivoracaceae bacterium]|nr:glycerophosphodiester phosphodiesterase [Alcanivoracaceae bacterium]
MLPAIVGHRGARGEAPENTLASFERAVIAGVTEIELDVRLSRDDELFVLHDWDLKRTTGHTGNAHKLPLASAMAHDARQAIPGWPTSCLVPSLQQVVDSCPPHMRFQFEVKADGKAPLKRTADRLARMIREQALEQRVVVTSSSYRFLSMMRNAAAEIHRGYVCQFRRNKPIQSCLDLQCHWLICHHGLVTTSLMDHVRRHDLGISVWTVNDLKEAERLISLGVSSIITDFPTGFLSHLRSRVARL